VKRKSLFRLLTTILGVLLATALIAAGCGDDDEDTTATTAPPATAAPPETTTEAPVPAEDPIHVGLVFDIGGRGDQSFNDSAAEGIERAEADLGIIVLGLWTDLLRRQLTTLLCCCLLNTRVRSW